VALDAAGLALPEADIALEAAHLPIFTELLAVCTLGAARTRRFARQLAHAAPVAALPPIHRAWIRSRAKTLRRWSATKQTKDIDGFVLRPDPARQDLQQSTFFLQLLEQHPTRVLLMDLWQRDDEERRALVLHGILLDRRKITAATT
jgi:hypothetical protein